MALEADLVTMANNKLQSLASHHSSARESLYGVLTLTPPALQAVVRAANDLTDFYKEFEKNKAELRSFVAPYPAAVGFMGPWQTIFAAWAYEDLDTSGVPSPRIKHMIDRLVKAYVDWVAS
jgi:hypothetical protein